MYVKKPALSWLVFECLRSSVMRPLSFDAPNEIQFIRDLEAFYQSGLGQQVIGKKSLYLVRNADTKAKGLGFALAGNFYPDYLLWLVDDETGAQCLNFIDPKGIRQMNLTDAKLGLYKEVKVLQEKLADPKLTLNAFILSATPFDSLINVVCEKKIQKIDMFYSWMKANLFTFQKCFQ